LGAGNLPVAVRSSATVEDLPGMSFAGQQETYLNVRSSDNVLEAVKRYRARQGIRP
jgi:pyruvate,water dikinase